MALLAAPAGAKVVFVNSWGTQYDNGGPGQFDTARGIALGTDGEVFVSDCGAPAVNRIQAFDDRGRFLRDFAFPGGADGEARCASGLAVSGAELLVADSGNHRIQVLDYRGNFIRKWGSEGGGDGLPGEFDGPGDPDDLAVYSSGAGTTVYAIEYRAERLQAFDAFGASKGVWGGPGEGNGEFRGPGGVAVDPRSGDVYVADTANNRIQRFDPTGMFVGA